ncbi:MAG: BlaI/MecI/CopY family transcriptional regulator [Planctomycetota bacterium]|nr:BlaI/MecI/CopY family transcriptional regulator [Planctomycetota bacterium]
MEALPNAELSLMECLWSSDRMTARDLREALYPNSTKAQHGTVQRLLQRLESKGFIERDRRLSVHFFSAKVTKEAYAGGQLETLATKLTGGSLAPMITHLVEENKISPAEIQRLRDILKGDD